MSLGGGDVTTTSKVQLSPEQQKLMDLGMPYAEKFAKTPLKWPGGQMIAPFSDAQKAGQQMAVQASGRQDAIAKNAQRADNFLLSGDLMDANKNPYLAPSIGAATRPIQQNLMESTLPGLRNDATMSGNFGSSRQGIAEGLASGRASQAMGDVGSKMAEDSYQSGLNAYQSGLQMSPGIQGMQTAGALTRSGVGDVQQAQNQKFLDRGIAKSNFEQMAPFMKASDILSLIAGTPGATNVSTGPGPQSNPITGALGGLTLGSALTPFLGPMGPLAGAALGGASSFF